MGTTRERHRTAEPTVVQFLENTRGVFDGFLTICGVCVNMKYSGGNYGRIQEGYYQFYEKPIVNSAGKRVNEFNKMMPLTDSVNSEISALFRRISPCVRFSDKRSSCEYIDLLLSV